MKKTIKIISILDDTTVLINAGSREGITTNDSFDIIDPKVEKIIDPDTKELLDEISRFKQRIYVKETKEKYSICVSKYSSTTVNASLTKMILQTSAKNLANSFNMAGTEEETKTYGSELNIDPKEADNILSKYSHAKVHVGDEVILVTKNK